MLINKIDQTNQPELEKLVAQWKELLPKAEIIPISALSNFNIDYVKRRVEELMPDSPPYFEKDALTDKPARFFVTEIIREKILLYYQKEIPYAVEVVVELFKEDDELISVQVITDDQHVVLQTKDGYFLRFSAQEVAEKKKAAVGVRGIKLRKNDELEQIYLFYEGTEHKISYGDRELTLNRLKVAKRDGTGTKARS